MVVLAESPGGIDIERRAVFPGKGLKVRVLAAEDAFAILKMVHVENGRGGCDGRVCGEKYCKIP